MASIPLSITNGTPPYTVTIYDNASNEPVTCTAGCASSPASTRLVTFTALAGTRNYRVKVTDSATTPCSWEQLTGNLTCAGSDQTITFALTANNPVCATDHLTAGSLVISNVVNGTRYNYQQGSSFVGNDCTVGLPLATGNVTTVPIPAPTAGTSQAYTVRVWSDGGCTNYTDMTVTVTSPSCTGNQTCTLAITLGTPTC